MLTLVCATCALFAIRFFATYSAAIAVGADLDTRELSSLGFSNRRFFGQLQTLTMPLLALPVLAARDSLRRTAAFVLLGSWWMLAFTSATRGTFFALAIAMPVAALWSSQLGARWFKLQVAGLAVGFALYVLLFLVLPQLVGVNVDIENRLNALFDSRGRIENWIYTMGIIGANPLLGVGPMHLAYWLNPETPVAHPHNSMLQIAAEWGIPAALLGAACVAYALRKYFQRFRGSNTTALSISIMATLVGTTFQSLVDGVIVMPVTQVFLVVMGGWALGLYLGLDLSRDQAERITIRKGLVTTSLAAILSVLIVTAFQDFGRLEARQEAYFADHGTYLHPRYWQQGWIGVPADPKPAP